MNWYFYLDHEGCPFKVQAAKRPSQRQWKRTWTVYEFQERRWSMACFPEVTWSTLKKMTFIGRVRSA